MASLTLLWLASYSNVTSIIVIILCFLAMTIFIGFVSITWDHNGSSRIATGVAQRNMIKLCNPFVIQLAQQNKKLSDGVHFHLSSLCPSKIFVLWGAKVDPFHDMILKTGKHIRDVLENPSSEDVSALDAFHTDQLNFPEAGEHIVQIPCPLSVSCDNLGDMPRKRYPVSVLTLVTDSFEEEQDSTQIDRENSIIGLITIVHLQDDKVTQNSHIISQFIKTLGVQVYSLQPLYLSSAPEFNQYNKKTGTDASASDGSGEEKYFYDTATMGNVTNTKVHSNEVNRKHSSLQTESSQGDDTDKDDGVGSSEETNSKNFPECVVCQTRQAKCALLPCRHACVCLGCFKLLDKCPMCRGDIDSYFLLSDGEEGEEEAEEEILMDLQQQAVSQHLSQLWERFNMRLNTLLGFR